LFVNLCKGRQKPYFFFSSQAKTDFFCSDGRQSRQAKTDFFHSMPFQSAAKINFLHSKLFLSGQERLLQFQAITVRPKPTTLIPSHFNQPNIVNKSSILLSMPCCSWSPNYSVLVFLQWTGFSPTLLSPPSPLFLFSQHEIVVGRHFHDDDDDDDSQRQLTTFRPSCWLTGRTCMKCM
jgi:hypothetical protein